MGAPVQSLASQSPNKAEHSNINDKRHRRHLLGNRLSRYYFFCSILALCFVLGLVIVFIGKTALLLFGDVSPAEFFLSFNWTPEEEAFGAAAFIVNTLTLTALTLLIAVPVSVGMAVLCAEIAPKWMKSFIRPVLDLLVGIPSIVYGYLGLTVMLPFLRRISGEGLGDGVLAAALVLALMVLPTICRISDDAIIAVPRKFRDAAYALGSTRLQVIIRVVLPAAKRGIISAIILGMTRAVGETMAVVMVIGNTPQLAKSLFTPSSVLTSNIVMQISNVEFDSTWNYALHMMAFLLLLISFVLILIIRVIGRKREDA
ncbi:MULTISPECIES: phosphate ABC transporter permease subunit PstC [unclassified Paenibacillus]|uniref:phosphate ABC transporter permease subunit PstC n=1 Tax=unclassified Paenibacillus TaxID=185978 RepID=UPI0024071C35|nr:MULTISPECIES: phosphate ABC transporter permease subunit PstC [unclassified Paenibacillus]MDF9844075.1 phosphate transport system permease protein [Paenibacillus sp. PastF-2]MDF9850680.1 phosphate transport system permease protein [Paenibacillus sp. PastM-2]MDF9858598.1 phosphate transport system permease protein [Paenibacillus sp. PastF-1]MDH6483859.1 phosphate transport system permease protein [Paenibacillus sp. PastH-2]MDH6509867.1 phosphate transport system permease protein [Paenibacill